MRHSWLTKFGVLCLNELVHITESTRITAHIERYPRKRCLLAIQYHVRNVDFSLLLLPDYVIIDERTFSSVHNNSEITRCSHNTGSTRRENPPRSLPAVTAATMDCLNGLADGLANGLAKKMKDTSDNVFHTTEPLHPSHCFMIRATYLSDTSR